MNCRACFSPNTGPMPFSPPKDDEPVFVRCSDCGSDSSPLNYDDIKHHYNTQNAIIHAANGGGEEMQRQHCWVNCEWFTRDPWKTLPKTFLDVGSCDGAALDNMVSLGWNCWGFDVLVPPDDRHRVVTASEFKADLFNRQFAAVLSREVLEHVPDPHKHLIQLVEATLPGGQLQLQTPRPHDYWAPHTYQTLHLCIFSPEKLQCMLTDAGLQIIDRMLWNEGQAYLCRKT